MEKLSTKKWKTILGHDREVVGVKDAEGQLIALFNPEASPLFRAALARNIIWTQGSIRGDVERNAYTFRDRWRKLFQRD